MHAGGAVGVLIACDMGPAAVGGCEILPFLDI